LSSLSSFGTFSYNYLRLRKNEYELKDGIFKTQFHTASHQGSFYDAEFSPHYEFPYENTHDFVYGLGIELDS